MSQKQHYTVDALPEAYRGIFEYSQFNELQSKCLPTLWHTNDSLVVSAPTGSGKTVLLELAVCRAFYDNSIATLAIYIAPTKCLVQQKVAQWRERFSTIGLTVVELTGDLDEVRDSLNGDISANLICTTPEKWDMEVHLGAGPTWLNGRKVNVYLIDEVHVVGEPDRGPILEAVLTRTIARCKSQLLFPRFVAISATIANPDDIGRWLGRHTPWHGFSFGENTRTVPVDTSVKGFYCPPERSSFHFDANLNYKLPMLIREVLPLNKSAIIFVCSRAATITCAKCLVNDRPWTRAGSLDELKQLAKSFKDKKLKEYIERGVGFHNAGLSPEDRSLLEKVFNRGLVRILVCTSTLAMGVNLPAYLVIVRGTTIVIGGVCEQYSAARIHQMIGRAGRPGLEQSGRAIIMTTSDQVARYESIVQGMQDTVESFLQRDLMRHVNREIVHKSIRSLPDAVAWLKSTFFFVRLAQNPKQYLPVGKSITELDEYIVQQCQKTFDSLFNMGLIEKTSNKIKNTELGRIFSRFYISFNGFESFIRELRNVSADGLSKEKLLTLIVQSQDFAGVQIRSSERTLLRKLNSHIRYKLSTKSSQWKDKEKIYLLLQSNLDRIDITDISPRIERSSLLKLACRVSRCLLESLLCLQRHKELCERLQIVSSINNFRTTRNIILLAKSFECGFWYDSVHCLQQLADVGIKRGTVLMFHGLASFRALRDSDPSLIELATNTQPPFGVKLKNRAENNFPRYSLDVVGHPDHLNITMSLANHQVNKVRAAAILIVGNQDIGIVLLRKVSRQELVAIGGLSLHLEVPPKWNQLNVLLINETLAGVDIFVSVSHPETNDKCSPANTKLLENLLPDTPKSAFTPSPKTYLTSSGSQVHSVTTVNGDTMKIQSGWEVPEVNLWAVKMIFAQPRSEDPIESDGTAADQDELIAAVEKAIALLDLDPEEKDNEASSPINPSQQSKHLSNEYYDGPINNNTSLLCFANPTGFAGSAQFEEGESSHRQITETHSPSSLGSPSSSGDSLDQLLDSVNIQGCIEKMSECRRSRTPEDLFDNIPSPKKFKDSLVHSSNDLPQSSKNSKSNTKTPVKHHKQKQPLLKREMTSGQISRGIQLSVSDNLAAHKCSTSTKRSVVNTKRAMGLISPVACCSSDGVSPVDLFLCETMPELDPTEGERLMPSSRCNATRKPRNGSSPKSDGSRSGIARLGLPHLAEARPLSTGTNESKVPPNLDALLESPSAPLAIEGGGEISQTTMTTAFQNIMDLIRDIEDFCKS